jgi:hypothetical protein
MPPFGRYLEIIKKILDMKFWTSITYTVVKWIINVLDSTGASVTLWVSEQRKRNFVNVIHLFLHRHRLHLTVNTPRELSSMLLNDSNIELYRHLYHWRPNPATTLSFHTYPPSYLKACKQPVIKVKQINGLPRRQLLEAQYYIYYKCNASSSR